MPEELLYTWKEIAGALGVNDWRGFSTRFRAELRSACVLIPRYRNRRKCWAVDRATLLRWAGLKGQKGEWIH